MAARVWNVNRVHPRDAVLIDRTTPFGNPFKLTDFDNDRIRCITTYQAWLMQREQKDLRELMRDVLRKEDLLCHCKPELCHGDIVLIVANSEDDFDANNEIQRYLRAIPR